MKVVNDKVVTSTIDLTFISSRIAGITHLQIYPDQLSSDHFRSIISLSLFNNYTVDNDTASWNLSKADWKLFNDNLSLMSFNDGLPSMNISALETGFIDAGKLGIPTKGIQTNILHGGRRIYMASH